MRTIEVDVLLVGAGLAGIGVAHHLQQKCPHKRFAILEARSNLGGTWDLFRYPGIRSDSRIPLYGYSFRPWLEDRAIAPGSVILDYLADTAREHRIDEKMHFDTRVTSASWSSDLGRWTVQATVGETQEPVTYVCSWLQLCTGYYSYDKAHAPEFPGQDTFEGPIIHPQFWPEDFDATGRRVVVIGSGATAVTLIPELAKQAAHVTMLQRSPTYIHIEPGVDRIAAGLRRLFPERVAYALVRKKNLYLERLGYRTARNKPEKLKQFLRKRIERALPKGYDIDRHFTPRYEPWDQRLCLCPDGDLFAAIRAGDASVVTDQIERFTPRGIQLASGQELEADVIVTATGLHMQIGGDMSLEVDGEPVEQRDRWIYKGVMLSGVPNMMLTAGTLVASYTLRVELIAQYLCRVLRHMDRVGAGQATPTLPVAESEMPRRPFVTGFSSGYLMRAIDDFPWQGDDAPWLNLQTYDDNRRVLEADVEDDTLVFTPRVPAARRADSASRPASRASVPG